jgi:hypothetical protein
MAVNEWLSMVLYIYGLLLTNSLFVLSIEPQEERIETTTSSSFLIAAYVTVVTGMFFM